MLRRGGRACSPGGFSLGAQQPRLASPSRFTCARTASESHLFQPKGLPFERKQIPQIVVIVRIQRKTMEPLEQTTVPWAQGVGRSNRPSPTNRKCDATGLCCRESRISAREFRLTTEQGECRCLTARAGQTRRLGTPGIAVVDPQETTLIACCRGREYHRNGTLLRRREALRNAVVGLRIGPDSTYSAEGQHGRSRVCKRNGLFGARFSHRHFAKVQ